MKRFFSFLAVLTLVFFGSFAGAQEVWYKALVKSFTTTPSPTPTPSAKPKPKASPTPATTPTASPTPMSTPTPTPTPTPSATPSPTPSATPNQAPAKRYLNLGADPQNADRQPIAGKEEVVVIDDDICDPAWGSGSGKKITGCYPKNSAVIRSIETKFVTAMYKCGNEPSEKHKVSGKVIPTTTPNLAAAVERIITNTKVLGEMELKVSGDVNVHHDGKITVEIAPQPSPTPVNNTSNVNGGSHSHKKLWLVIGAAVVSGGGVWLYNHQKDKPGAPGVRTLPTKPICTGVGCPSGSGFGASFSLGFK